MTDLEQLAKFSESDINKVMAEKWKRWSKHCHKTNKQPKFYLIGGQPGAGKSTTISEIQKSMDNNCIVVNLDDYRALHPNAKEIYEKGAKDSDDYSVYTNAFMREVGKKIIDKAIENGYNVILERTLGSTNSVSSEIDKFSKNGYELNLYVVSCKKEHSISSAETRYLNGKINYENNKIKEPPRKISLEFQKECYENLGKSAQTLAKKYDFKDIKIFYRSLQYKRHCVFDKNSQTKTNDTNKIEYVVDRLVYGKEISKSECDKMRKSLIESVSKIKQTSQKSVNNEKKIE